ncbi:MAG: hypothetical protein Q4A15_01505 [Prevotellaceae bacterium]|nr:hypothetical protein [Prevotellaceae bacterium]
MKTVNEQFSDLQRNELQSFFKNTLTEALAAVKDLQHAEWYKTCTFEEMKNTIVDYLYSDETGQFIGEGTNTISSNFILNDETQNDFIRAFNEARNAVWSEFLWKKFGGSIITYGSVPVLVEREEQMQDLFDVLKVTPYNEISPKDIPDAMKKLCLSSAIKVKRIFGFVFNGFNGLVCFDGDYVC